MGDKLFQKAALRRRSLLQRLFSQYPQENAVIEVNNLLAAKPVLTISRSDIEEIERRHATRVRTEFKLNMEEFYAVVLNYYATRFEVSAQEKDELYHLSSLLALDKKSVDDLHVKIGHLNYRKFAKQFISNGQLSDKETGRLEKLRDFLQLPKSSADKIWEQEAETFIVGYAKKILASGVYSPTKEKEFEAVITNLRVHIPLPKDISVHLAKLKQYWALENLPMPVVQAAAVLQKTEVCHIHIPQVEWHETRALRVGGRSTQVMQLIDTGSLYLTNKRIVFHGRLKNHIIKTEAILNFSTKGTEISISKITGKNPMLKVSAQADAFAILLKRVLRG